jgi:hypothetical protein
LIERLIGCFALLPFCFLFECVTHFIKIDWVILALKLKFTRASVKKLSGALKLSRKQLGTSQDVQIVDHGTATHIEEILAQTAIASAPPLPVTDVGQGMLNRHPLAQFAASVRRLLALA